jgi:hypothetical protein
MSVLIIIFSNHMNVGLVQIIVFNVKELVTISVISVYLVYYYSKVLVLIIAMLDSLKKTIIVGNALRVTIIVIKIMYSS